MGIKALKTGKQYDYVSTKDDGWSVDGNHKPEATVWKLRVLTGQEMAEIRDLQANVNIDIADGKSGTPALRMSMYKTAYKTLEYGLIGWQNFTDENGNGIPFEKDEKGRPSQKTLGLIPPDVAFELSRELVTINLVDESVVGNSKAS